MQESPTTPPEAFVNYYEVLEASPQATPETIERLFRLLAKKLHPDVAESGDVKKFSELVEAYHTLKDPDLRAAYDSLHAQHVDPRVELTQEAAPQTAEDDTAQREQILHLFYAQRKRSMKKPGLPTTTIETAVGAPEEVINFHLWYFLEKGWLRREESGLLSITAGGVDRIEEITIARQAASQMKRLTDEGLHVEDKSEIKDYSS